MASFSSGNSVTLKGRGGTWIENRDGRGLDFHFPSRDINPLGSRHPPPDLPADREYVLPTEIIGSFEEVRVVRLEHHLGQSMAIPYIHEDLIPEVPGDEHPAIQGGCLPDVLFAEIPAGVCPLPLGHNNTSMNRTRLVGAVYYRESICPQGVRHLRRIATVNAAW